MKIIINKTRLHLIFVYPGRVWFHGLSTVYVLLFFAGSQSSIEIELKGKLCGGVRN